MIFYLGTHLPNWLWTKNDKIPLFVSDTTLRKYKKYKKANFIWALDSGGFSELHKFGKWVVTPKEYAERVLRYDNEIGKLQFAAIQDWMCEESVRKKTKKTVLYHQEKTIESYHTLNSILPNVPWRAVLQGQTPDDYMRHLDMYKKSGVKEKYFGLGSVCRRANSSEIIALVEMLYDEEIKIHGFGVKTTALKKISKYLDSADSLAWSFGARYDVPRYKSCNHKNCANCYNYAKMWYRKQLRNIS